MDQVGHFNPFYSQKLLKIFPIYGTWAFFLIDVIRIMKPSPLGLPAVPSKSVTWTQEVFQEVCTYFKDDFSTFKTRKGTSQVVKCIASPGTLSTSREEPIRERS